ncbi:D(1) dopamine receptor-like [Hydractinia symbiolongicarpus]|uniref:D(1) dopamine receptor-like n=1 Tax=Hydractinia symbiolongicarpus TaxID=13093 RepID=UPI00254CD77D|nr:D(1) dopamine receptor-like [Hydractinia symbiolongicarpus]XP_057290993.1 D(1) dopamine receptor-like [Hydractinia symbiolongicarpus]
MSYVKALQFFWACVVLIGSATKHATGILSNQPTTTPVLHNQSSTTSLLSNRSNTSLSQPVDPCSESTTLRYSLFALFSITIILVGVTGNILSVVVILFSRNLRRQVTYRFIVSLAMADLGVSFFITTYTTDFYLHNTNFCLSLRHCYYYIFNDHLFPIASITHFMVIAVDRCIAISMPFFYSAYFTKATTNVIIFVIWFYALLWTSFTVVPWYGLSEILLSKRKLFICYTNYNNVFPTVLVCVVYLIPAVITTCMYIIMSRIATKQAAAIAKLNPHTHGKMNRIFKKDLRAYKTVAVVFAAYIFCFLPRFIYYLVVIWDINAIVKLSQCCPTAFDAVTTLINKVLPTLNSCVNPFIYFVSSAHFRVAFKDLLYKLLGKPREGIHYPDDSTHVPSNIPCRGSFDNTIDETTLPRGKSFNCSINKISNESLDNIGKENDSKL